MRGVGRLCMHDGIQWCIVNREHASVARRPGSGVASNRERKCADTIGTVLVVLFVVIFGTLSFPISRGAVFRFCDFQNVVHWFQKVALWDIIQEGLNYRKTQGNQKWHEVSIHLQIWGGAPRLYGLTAKTRRRNRGSKADDNKCFSQWRSRRTSSRKQRNRAPLLVTSERKCA